ncbi:hypothetical protein [Rhizorhabdus wittichii]|uniref:hypothetical protein n=1 Tax=Rhizorhabdus wittichii TaxID=160791 RepID=UPI0012FD3EB2|nr:hypothetical protein [Rhizorhabdus wittichii]
MEIENLIFKVPQDDLIDYSRWWSFGDSPSVSFYIHSPSSRDNIIVTLQTYNGVCHREAGEVGNVPTFCRGDAVIQDNRQEYHPGDLIKKVREEDSVGWSYVERKSSKFVSSCTEKLEADGEGGYCLSLGKYKNLFFTIRFRENSVSELPIVVKNIKMKLESWEMDG